MEAVDCEACDLAAVRIFTPPIMVQASADVCYDSPIDGRPITTHAARRDDLARNGCIEYDPEMKSDMARRKQERQDAFEAAMDETVKTEIGKMSSGTRAVLKKEVINMGMSLEVTRESRH